MEPLKKDIVISSHATNFTIPVTITTGSRNKLCFHAYLRSNLADYYIICVRNQSHAQLVFSLESQRTYELTIKFLNVSSSSWSYEVTVVKGTECVHIRKTIFLRCHIEVDDTARPPKTSSMTTSATVTNKATPGICSNTLL